MSSAKPIEIKALSVGKSKHLQHEGKEWRTAIVKSPQTTKLWFGQVNIQDDEQEHLQFHGGPERAVCLYPYEHYALWEAEYGVPLPTAAFGENLSVTGMLEEQVCIGDLYRFGDALLQVSQPRIPCAQVDMRNGMQGLFKRFMETGYTGYFFRVIEEGEASRESELTLVERDPNGITVLKANHIFHHQKENRKAIQRLLDLSALAPVWKERLAARLETLEKDSTDGSERV